MMKLHFKQAWQLLKQNPLFSGMYVLGTGLAIAMTMIIAIVYYIKIAPVYPEANRPLTMTLKSVTSVNLLDKEGQSSFYSSHQVLKEWYYPIKEAEVVSAVFSDWEIDCFAQASGGGEQIPVSVKFTDPAFFRLYVFSFVAGKPFTEADFESGIRSVVLAKSVARRIFGTEEAVGRTFSMNYAECRVAGVVRDASCLTENSFAQIYLPYTCVKGYDKSWGDCEVLGPFEIYFKARSAAGMDSIRLAVDEILRKYNTSQQKYELRVYNQPDVYWKSVFRIGNREIDWTEVVKLYGGILLALLLVPALNLSGMISGRMDARLSEMGVRKAFGASRRLLLGQLINENLFLTCLGGLVGLILAWLSLVVFRNWLFSLFSEWPSSLPDGVDTIVSVDMLFSPLVFVLAFGVCVVFNLLSALMPARVALRKNIVYSLNEKK